MEFIFKNSMKEALGQKIIEVLQRYWNVKGLLLYSNYNAITTQLLCFYIPPAILLIINI